MEREMDRGWPVHVPVCVLKGFVFKQEGFGEPQDLHTQTGGLTEPSLSLSPAFTY